MITCQYRWTTADGWETPGTAALLAAALVVVFGSRERITSQTAYEGLRARFPSACILGCSTAGEIANRSIEDDALVATGISFNESRVVGHAVSLAEHRGAFDAGASLAGRFEQAGLIHIFVLSDGIAVNGSELVSGLASRISPGIPVTGGMAGDGGRMAQAVVRLDDAVGSGVVAGVGFYGHRLRIGWGTVGRGTPFGPERVVTRSRGNALYELDGVSALSVHKAYLGEHAEGLPAA